MALHSIITGDIVSSQNIPPKMREKLFDDLAVFLKELKKKWINNYEAFRGDSIQCEAKSPEMALRIALMIRAFLKGYLSEEELPKAEANRVEERTKGYFTTEFDIRLGIGIGKIDFIKKNKLTSSDGEAFRFSGEALDNLKQVAHRLTVKTLNKDFDEQLEPAILLLDAVIQKWTLNAAELVLYLLQNKKEEEIAGLLNISQSAVNQRKKNAQWFAMDKLIQYFEKAIKSWE